MKTSETKSVQSVKATNKPRPAVVKARSTAFNAPAGPRLFPPDQQLIYRFEAIAVTLFLQCSMALEPAENPDFGKPGVRYRSKSSVFPIGPNPMATPNASEMLPPSQIVLKGR